MTPEYLDIGGSGSPHEPPATREDRLQALLTDIRDSLAFARHTLSMTHSCRVLLAEIDADIGRELEDGA